MKTASTSSALTRRRFFQASAVGLAAPFVIRSAYAAWPDRPVKLLVPFGAGGPVDVLARVLQPMLSEELGANLFVENRVGAAGNIGVGMAARSEPDGYTILITSNTIVINPLLYKSVPYDLEKDFEPLVDLAGSPTAFTVNPKLGINSVAEFVALAKEKKGAHQLWQRGICDAVASGRRVFQEPRRHRDDSCSVQRRRSGKPGAARRHGRYGLRRACRARILISSPAP